MVQGGGAAYLNMLLHSLKKVLEQKSSFFNYPHLLGALAQTHTKPFLDAFFLDEDLATYKLRTIFGERYDPPRRAPEKAILEWCEQDASSLYIKLTRYLHPIVMKAREGYFGWKPIVHRIVANAPNLTQVLDAISSNAFRGLREQPEAFEALRGDYPFRREPGAYSVKLFQSWPEINHLFESLGFAVLADQCY